MSRCIHVYPFAAGNHGGIPFSDVCPSINFRLFKEKSNAPRPSEQPPQSGEKMTKRLGSLLFTLHGMSWVCQA